MAELLLCGGVAVLSGEWPFSKLPCGRVVELRPYPKLSIGMVGWKYCQVSGRIRSLHEGKVVVSLHCKVSSGTMVVLSGSVLRFRLRFGPDPDPKQGPDRIHI